MDLNLHSLVNQQKGGGKLDTNQSLANKSKSSKINDEMNSSSSIKTKNISLNNQIETSD